MEQVDQFIEQIMVEKGVDDIDPEVKAELKADMQQRLLDQINKAAIMQLSEEKAAELAAKIDDPNFTDEDISAFIQGSGVDLAQVALETMLQFRDFYLGSGE